MPTYTKEQMVKAAWTQYKGSGSTYYKTTITYEDIPGSEVVHRVSLWANTPEEAEDITVYNTFVGPADPAKIAERATQAVRKVNVVEQN